MTAISARLAKQARAGAMLVFAVIVLAATEPASFAATPFVDVGKQAPISVLVNSSPWFAPFETVVKLYEEQTGNKVSLDVTPFGGMLEKTRNAVRSSPGTHDIVNLNATWVVEFLEGGQLAPLKTIDPNFDLPKEALRYDDAGYWNATTHWRTSNGGDLYGVTPNGNIHLMYWRSDLYEKAGLKVPETWEDVAETCEKLEKKPALNGYGFRGDRAAGIWFDSAPIFWSYGAHLEKDPEHGDFTVTINSAEGKRALDMLLDIARKCGPPNIAALTQGDLIQSLATGKLVAGHAVTAAWPTFDDPKKSTVVGKMQAARLPAARGGRPGVIIGDWLLAVPKSVPDDRKRAAVAFMKWFLTAEAQLAYVDAGGIPVRSDSFTSAASNKPENRWMKAYLDSMPYAHHGLDYREGPAVEAIVGLRLNQALLGQLSAAAALNKIAAEVKGVFEKSGRKTGLLPKLAE